MAETIHQQMRRKAAQPNPFDHTPTIAEREAFAQAAAIVDDVSVRVGIVVENPGGVTADLPAVSTNSVVVSKRAGSLAERQAAAADLAEHLYAALREWMHAHPGTVWDDYAGLFTVDPSRLKR